MAIKDPFEGIKDPFEQGGPEYPVEIERQAPPAMPYDQLRQETAGMGPLKRGIIGVGQGMTEAGRGLQQIYYGLTGQPEKYADVTRAGIEERAMLEPLGTAGKVGSVVGQTAPYMAMPGGVAGSAWRRAGTAALGGLTAGGLSFAENAEQRGVNALLGGTGAAAGSGLMSGVSKLINAPSTKVPANKWNIPTTLSEGTTGVSSRTDVLMERAPGIFGTKAFRERQHNSASRAAKEFVGNYVVNPSSPDVVTANRNFVNGLYNDMRQIIADVPQNIRPSNTQAAARDLIEQYPEVFEKLQDQKTKRIVQDVLKGSKPGSSNTTNVTIDTTGGLFPTTLQVGKTDINYRSFDDMWELRKALGENMGFAKKELNKTNYARYKQLWQAVTDDLDQWATTIGRPDVMQKFRAANDAYKQYVVKHNVIQQAYDRTVTQLGEKELFSPQRFANNLKRIIEKDKAIKTFSPGEIQEMTGLANIMQVVKRSGQYLENPPTGNRWGALTGAGMAEAALFKAGGVAGMAKGTAVAALAAGATKFLTTTNAGKKLALAASKVEPDSPAMKAIVNTIMRQAPKYAGTAAKEAGMATPLEESMIGVSSDPTPEIKDVSFDDWRKQEYIP